MTKENNIVYYKKAKNEEIISGFNERIKELNCLYGLSGLVEKYDVQLEKIFHGLVNLIPSAWHYPEIVWVRIVFGNKGFKTGNCKASKWRQSAGIMIHGNKVGTIEVGYRERKTKIEEGISLKTGVNLVSVVAERLGRIAERQKVEDALCKSEAIYKTLVNHIPKSIFIKDRSLIYIFCNEAYAADHIMKPFDTEVLLNLIRKYV